MSRYLERALTGPSIQQVLWKFLSLFFFLHAGRRGGVCAALHRENADKSILHVKESTGTH